MLHLIQRELAELAGVGSSAGVARQDGAGDDRARESGVREGGAQRADLQRRALEHRVEKRRGMSASPVFRRDARAAPHPPNMQEAGEAP